MNESVGNPDETDAETVDVGGSENGLDQFKKEKLTGELSIMTMN